MLIAWGAYIRSAAGVLADFLVHVPKEHPLYAELECVMNDLDGHGANMHYIQLMQAPLEMFALTDEDIDQLLGPKDPSRDETTPE